MRNVLFVTIRILNSIAFQKLITKKKKTPHKHRSERIISCLLSCFKGRRVPAGPTSLGTRLKQYWNQSYPHRCVLKSSVCIRQGTLGYTCALLCSGLRVDDEVVTETSCFSTPILIQALGTDWPTDYRNRSRDACGKTCTDESLLEARLYKD